jgi:uncharacterized protein (TIGR02246 family)
MRKQFWIAALSALLFASPMAGQGGGEADEKAIREIETRWEAGWNAHDASALAQLVAPDTDFINARGRRIKSRDEFLEANSVAQRGIFKESVWKTHEVEIKLVAPELAIVHVYWTLRGDLDEHGHKRPEHQGLSTQVVVKREGRWLILASQSTAIQPAP